MQVLNFENNKAYFSKDSSPEEKLQAVETYVASQYRDYTHENRENQLHQILKPFGKEAILEIAKAAYHSKQHRIERMAEDSYRNPVGFQSMRLLHNPELGFDLRFHLWRPDNRQGVEGEHMHPFDTSSTMILGMFRNVFVDDMQLLTNEELEIVQKLRSNVDEIYSPKEAREIYMRLCSYEILCDDDEIAIREAGGLKKLIDHVDLPNLMDVTGLNEEELQQIAKVRRFYDVPFRKDNNDEFIPIYSHDIKVFDEQPMDLYAGDRYTQSVDVAHRVLAPVAEIGPTATFFLSSERIEAQNSKFLKRADVTTEEPELYLLDEVDIKNNLGYIIRYAELENYITQYFDESFKGINVDFSASPDEPGYVARYAAPAIRSLGNAHIVRQLLVEHDALVEKVGANRYQITFPDTMVDTINFKDVLLDVGIKCEKEEPDGNSFFVKTPVYSDMILSNFNLYQEEIATHGIKRVNVYDISKNYLCQEELVFLDNFLKGYHDKLEELMKLYPVKSHREEVAPDNLKQLDVDLLVSMLNNALDNKSIIIDHEDGHYCIRSMLEGETSKQIKLIYEQLEKYLVIGEDIVSANDMILSADNSDILIRPKENSNFSRALDIKCKEHYEIDTHPDMQIDNIQSIGTVVSKAKIAIG